MKFCDFKIFFLIFWYSEGILTAMEKLTSNTKSGEYIGKVVRGLVW
ncbi:hypothetical protein DCCM_1042 [Desulfocucumis palustris]|uniref:Uncharacterized protein n=1 Tax=Desulfocucumis palustris TaxID=1898651 RepID=A0A2L2XF31_9FIRM|nr:hypothetical protein DCCM_1042 [Desulfocucumis palustris]